MTYDNDNHKMTGSKVLDFNLETSSHSPNHNFPSVVVVQFVPNAVVP